MAARIEIPELERALSVVGLELDFPEELDLAPAVAAELAARPARRPLFRLRSLRLPVLRPPAVLRPAWQVVVAAVVAGLVAFSGVLAASPGVRQAVERWFGLGGVRIVRTPPPSTLPPVRRLGEGLDLGRPTTLADAERHLGQRILLPAGLGQPDAVYVRDLTVGGAEVFLVYRPRAGIPAARETGVGLLVSEFTGDLYRPGLEKLSFGAKIERVRVDDSPGFWVEGGHGVTYLDRDGNVVGDDLRLAGSVLLWQRGTLTLRIESALSKADSLRIARTIG